jgi:hypothetical protein
MAFLSPISRYVVMMELDQVTLDIRVVFSSRKIIMDKYQKSHFKHNTALIMLSIVFGP